jgi:hypothetical protein
MKRALLLLALAAAVCTARAEIALNPHVTQDTIAHTICRPGYTGTVRPAVSFTNAIKYRLMEEAGIARADAHKYELDHIVNLGLGGAPRSLDNLQLQPWDGADGARIKDHLEVRLQRLVCAGKVPLEEAQRCIYDDWRACAKHHPSTTVKEAK